MKILHVSYVYPPKLGIADGITTVMQNVTKGLSNRGHDVSVYTSNMLDLHGNTSLYSGTSVISNITVYYSKSIWRFNTIFFTPSIILMFSKNLSKYDIIHIHDCRSFQGIIAYFFTKIKKIPYVYQPHGSFLFSNLDTSYKKLVKIFLDNLISNKIVHDSSKIIALNQNELEELKIFGISEKKIVIVPNGIDLSEYSNLPYKGSFKKKFGINKNTKIVLYLGRVHKIKGVDILVKAFKNILNELANVKLVIAGPDDGYLGEIEALIKALRIKEQVLVSGPLYGKDKFEAYVDSDVYVLPSRYEIWGMTVLEAIACGTPVVLSKNCVLADYVKDKVGLVADLKVMALAQAIIRIIEPAKQDLFRKNCAEFIKQFGNSTTISKIETVYRDVISRCL